MSEDKKDNEATSRFNSFFKGLREKAGKTATELGEKAGQKANEFGDKIDDKIDEQISDLMKTNPEAASAAILAKSGGKKAAKAFAKAAKEKPLTTAATVLTATSGAGLIRSAIYVGAGAMGDKYKDKLKDSLSGKFAGSHDDVANDDFSRKPSNDDDIIEAEFEEIKDDQPKNKSNGNDFKP